MHATKTTTSSYSCIPNERENPSKGQGSQHEPSARVAVAVQHDPRPREMLDPLRSWRVLTRLQVAQAWQQLSGKLFLPPPGIETLQNPRKT